MGFYERRIFPLLNERMSTPTLVAIKREALKTAYGRVIEIGIGSAMNLELYPPAVESAVGIDPNPGMNTRAQARAKAARFPVELEGLSGETLPFADSSFDTAISTLVFCTIADTAKAIAEVRRVLKPTGRFLFVEHGKSQDPRVAVWQRRLNPIQRVVACGCELDRDIPAIIEPGGFRFEALRTLQLDGAPRTHGFLYVGDARPTSAPDRSHA